jgi:hypothetical protein
MTTYATTPEVAAHLRVSPTTVQRIARKLGVGINIRGSAGWRFSPADVAAIEQALRPAQVPAPRRRRRSA